MSLPIKQEFYTPKFSSNVNVFLIYKNRVYCPRFFAYDYSQVTLLQKLFAGHEWHHILFMSVDNDPLWTHHQSNKYQNSFLALGRMTSSLWVGVSMV